MRGPVPTHCENDDSRFNICIALNDADSTPTFAPAFDAAAVRWEQIITGDLSSYSMFEIGAQNPTRTIREVMEGECGFIPNWFDNSIDDLDVCATFPAIDGVGGVLGAAGPLFTRPDNGLPASGFMRFDIADVLDFQTKGFLQDCKCTSIF